MLLCTDGDFNLGVTSNDALVQLIATSPTATFATAWSTRAKSVPDIESPRLTNWCWHVAPFPTLPAPHRRNKAKLMLAQ